MKRLPTKAEFEALLKLPHKWDEERNGLLVTADNGNRLFFPAMGYKHNADVYDVEHDGYYWSATPYNKGKAWYIYFSSFEALLNNYSHNFGRTIRLISDNPCNGYVDMGTGIYWAIENYHEGEKIYFTWDEAMEIPQKINGGKVECGYPNYNLLNQKQSGPACTHMPEENVAVVISDNVPIDWERRRYEIAKAVLGGLSARQVTHMSKTAADIAVSYADALIDKLKEK